jgi:hypothetical protein
MTVEERFNSDPEFHMLVMAMYRMIEDATYTPSEMREALIFAFTLYETHHLRVFRMEIPIPDENSPMLSKKTS